MTGEVNSNLEAIIKVVLRRSDGGLVRVDAAIDTGFSDYLTLPSEVIESLNLAYYETYSMVVADQSIVSMRVYEADVLWDGHPRTIFVHESEGFPLVGMLLMEGYVLTVEAVDGGAVRLEPL